MLANRRHPSVLLICTSFGPIGTVFTVACTYERTFTRLKADNNLPCTMSGRSLVQGPAAHVIYNDLTERSTRVHVARLFFHAFFCGYFYSSSDTLGLPRSHRTFDATPSLSFLIACLYSRQVALRLQNEVEDLVLEVFERLPQTVDGFREGDIAGSGMDVSSLFFCSPASGTPVGTQFRHVVTPTSPPGSCTFLTHRSS